jgi:hypothetical protein
VGVNGDADKGYEGTITNCYNTGTITSTGEYSVGGVVGINNSKVEKCYNIGGVNSTHGGTGGIVGWNEGDVTNCYNTGVVFCNGSDYNTGGIVGGNIGNITYCYNIGSVTGTNSVGGISGGNYNGSSSSPVYGNINNCVSLGLTVTGTSQYSVGRVLGYEIGDLNDNRARNDMTLIGDGVPRSADPDATGKDGAGVDIGDSLENVFENWDPDIWDIPSTDLTIGGSLPTLQDMPTVGDTSVLPIGPYVVILSTIEGYNGINPGYDSSTGYLTIPFNDGGVYWLWPAGFNINNYNKMTVEYTTSGATFGNITGKNDHLEITVKAITADYSGIIDGGTNYGTDIIFQWLPGNYVNNSLGNGTFTIGPTYSTATNRNFDTLKASGIVGFCFAAPSGPDSEDNIRTFTLIIRSITFEP